MGEMLLEPGAVVRVVVPEPPTFQASPPDSGGVVLVPVAGPPGPPGGASFSHHQSTPAATWTIIHNLDQYRDALVFLDTDPTRAVYPDLDYPDPDTLVVTFPSPAAGWVYL